MAKGDSLVRSLRKRRSPEFTPSVSGNSKNDETVYDSQPLTQPAVSSQEVLEREHSSHEESMELKAWLQPLDNGLDRIEIFDSSIVVVGRSDEDPAVDFTLNRLRRSAPTLWATLSRRHFSIEKRLDGTFVTDLSRNGTFLNRELIGNGRTKEIFHRDVISIGHASFFSYMFEESRSERDLPPALYEKYLITGTVLGTGGYGKVVLGKLRQSATRWVAIKMLAKTKLAATASRSAADSKDIKNELACMRDIDHPNCIRIEDSVETVRHAFIVLEYVDGGEMYDRIVDEKRGGAGLGERLTRFYSLQVLRALEYLHGVGIIHRDIKPENILLVDRHDYTVAKLSDFGLSKRLNAQSTMKTFCGTPTYIAPEMLENENEPYSPAVDMWSLGVVLFTAIVGYPPFSEGYDDGMELNDQIKTGRLIYTRAWKNVSLLGQQAVARMLKVDPQQRMTPTSALAHGWFDAATVAHVDDVVGKYQERKRV